MKATAKRLTKADLVRELRAAHKNARRWETRAKMTAATAASLLDDVRRLKVELATLRNRGHEPVLRHDALTATGQGPRVTWATGQAMLAAGLYHAALPSGEADPIYCESPEWAERVAATLNAADTPTLDKLALEVAEWSLTTFGHGRERATAEHLVREAAELRDAVDREDKNHIAEECADVFILLATLTRRCGVALLYSVAHKFSDVKARVWAEEDEIGVIEHVRGGK